MASFKTILEALPKTYDSMIDKNLKELKDKIQKATYALDDLQAQYKKLTGKTYVF